MSNHLVGGLLASRWLLEQATFEYLALIPLALICLWSLVEARRSRNALFVLFLPICWLLPMVLAGAFTDWKSQEVKTADWVGTAALVALVVQVVWSASAIVVMKGQRVLAIAGTVVNAGIGLLALFVVGMDASGDWL